MSSRSRKKYTPEEDKFIEENWRDMSDAELAEELERSPHGVQYERLKLGLKRTKGRSWSEKEDEFIEENWRDMSDAELAEELGRTPRGIQWERLKLGLKRTKVKSWSKRKVLKRLKDLARELGRTPVMADDLRLTSAALRYFDTWNEARKAAGFNITPPYFRSSKYTEAELEEIIRIAIRIASPAEDKKTLAQKLSQVVHDDDWSYWVDLYQDENDDDPVRVAEIVSRKILRWHSKRYLRIRDGWAEETFEKMTGEGLGVHPRKRPDENSHNKKR